MGPPQRKADIGRADGRTAAFLRGLELTEARQAMELDRNGPREKWERFLNGSDRDLFDRFVMRNLWCNAERRER
jgi:hypothetical protein